MRHVHWLALAALALLARPAAAQTTLRYQFKDGEKLQYALAQDMKMSMSLADRQFEVTIRQALDMNWEVVSVDAQGGARVRLTFGRIKLSLNSPTGSADFDSAEKPKAVPDNGADRALEQMGQALAALEITFILTPRGETKDVKVSDEVLKKLKAIPGSEKFGAELLTPDGLNKMVGGGLLLPAEPVAKGTTWKQQKAQKLQAARLSGEVVYAYEGPVEKGGRTLEKVAIRPDLRLDNDADTKIQIKLKGQKDQGDAYFDNRAGRLVEVTNAGTMELEVGSEGVTVSQRITQSMTLRLKEGGGSR